YVAIILFSQITYSMNSFPYAGFTYHWITIDVLTGPPQLGKCFFFDLRGPIFLSSHPNITPCSYKAELHRFQLAEGGKNSECMWHRVEDDTLPQCLYPLLVFYSSVHLVGSVLICWIVPTMVFQEIESEA